MFRNTDQAEHTRAPVAPHRNLGNVVGLVHIHQLIGQRRRPGADVVSDVPIFPGSPHVLTTLRDLQHAGCRWPWSSTSTGGADGIVTVEDLVEELVGGIYDETIATSPGPVTTPTAPLSCADGSRPRPGGPRHHRAGR